MRVATVLAVLGAVLFSSCAAQSSSTGSSSTTTSLTSTSSSSLPPSYSYSVVNLTSTLVVPLSTRSSAIRSRSTTIVRTITSTESFIITPTSTSTTSTNATNTLSASATATTTAPPSIHLNTKVDGAFACLGVLLVLTGLPTAFLGHKNRWSSFFLLGFYTLAAVAAVLILKFGVLDRQQQQLSLPDAKLRGLYLFACSVAGFVGGGIAVFFWQLTKYLIGGLGGFVFALWIQCMHHSGLVQPIGYRWLMYIGVSAIGFTLCTVPKLHYHVLLGATAMVGATAFILGVDCFTTAGLKEFYVWNLGYHKLFPKFAKIGFGVSQTIAIELGLIAAVALAGAAVQLRVLSMLRVRLQELQEEHRRKDQELENEAAEKFRDVEAAREEWEKKHGNGASRSGGGGDKYDGVEKDSISLSAAPILNRDGWTGTPTSEPPGTPGTLGNNSLYGFPKSISPDPTRPPQAPGALPAMDLGSAVKDALPSSMISTATMLDDHPEIRQRTELLNEINGIRRSIDALSATSGSASGYGTGGRERRYSSFGDLDRATGADAAKAVAETSAARAEAAFARPQAAAALPTSVSGRDRVRSMFDMPAIPRLSNFMGMGAKTARPTSTPLADDDWETYVQERKLFVPPSGVTAPIPTSVIPEKILEKATVTPSDAVMAAVAQRQRRESMFDPIPEQTAASGSGGDHRKSWISYKDDEPAQRTTSPPTPTASRPVDLARAPSSSALRTPPPAITVLPPVRHSHASASYSSPPQQQQRPAPAERVLSFEEYESRHKARMHALQKPLTKQEIKEATLADARARWEKSKEVERKVMERKQAAEQAKLDERRKSIGDDLEANTKRKSRHSRSLSLELLNQSPPNRMSSSTKVEEWQKYQAASVAESSAGESSIPAPPRTRPSAERKRSSKLY